MLCSGRARSGKAGKFRRGEFCSGWLWCVEVGYGRRGKSSLGKARPVLVGQAKDIIKGGY